MLLYGIIILVCMILVTVLNIFLNPMNLPWYHYLVAVVVMVIAMVIIDAIIAGICRALPEKRINPEKKFFSATRKEQEFYVKIGIKKWKDIIPELGQFTGFHKDRMVDPKDNKYITRFIKEACYGVLGHFYSMPLSFLVLFVDYGMWTNGSNLFLTIGIPVAIINVILNFLPYCVLGFNIPKLKVIYKFNERNKRVAEMQK